MNPETTTTTETTTDTPETKLYTLYKISDTNADGEHAYIGITSNYNLRMCQHKHNSKAGIKQIPIYNYIRESGKTWNDMKKLKLREWICTAEEAFNAEREAIKALAPDLNVRAGNSYYNSTPCNPPVGFSALGISYTDDPKTYHKIYLKHWRLANLDRRRSVARALYNKNSEELCRRYALKTEFKRLGAIDVEPSDYHIRRQRYLAEARRFRNISLI